jgi:hypothetical protein
MKNWYKNVISEWFFLKNFLTRHFETTTALNTESGLIQTFRSDGYAFLV